MADRLTDAELDVMVRSLQKKCPFPAAGNSVVIKLMGDAADALTALRAERDKAIELCGKAQDRWNEGIDERERLQSALIDMTTELDVAYARGGCSR